MKHVTLLRVLIAAFFAACSAGFVGAKKLADVVTIKAFEPVAELARTNDKRITVVEASLKRLERIEDKLDELRRDLYVTGRQVGAPVTPPTTHADTGAP